MVVNIAQNFPLFNEQTTTTRSIITSSGLDFHWNYGESMN